MADKEEGEQEKAPVSEKPAAAAVVDAEAPAADAKEPEKPVSKTVEWALAFAMMAILVGFLFMMIYMMRSARGSLM